MDCASMLAAGVGVLPLLIIVGGVLLFVFWLSQFVMLMGLADEHFPGRHDKVLWFIAVFFGHLIGALAFWLWRRMMVTEASTKKG